MNLPQSDVYTGPTWILPDEQHFREAIGYAVSELYLMVVASRKTRAGVFCERHLGRTLELGCYLDQAGGKLLMISAIHQLHILLSPSYRDEVKSLRQELVSVWAEIAGWPR